MTMSGNICRWKGCCFQIDYELLEHLSNDHIGWKKEVYECLWDDCHRKDLKWNNRFSFISHIRIHTGSSPYECQYCYKTFSNMEGLEKHVKTEHEGIEKKVPASIKKKRKLLELQQRYNDQLSDDSDDLQDLPLVLDDISSLKTSTTTNKKLKKDSSSIKDQYKLAKAQLNYILRENEMLCDEWANTEKKLKRLRTERRVLLDALIKRGYNNEDEN